MALDIPDVKKALTNHFDDSSNWDEYYDMEYDEGVINTADSMTVEPPLNHKNLKNLLRNLITE